MESRRRRSILQQLAGFDAVVHLAGKNIAGRWSEKFKQEVRDSRVQGTRTLATAAAESFRQTGKPRAFIAASAIGYYGNRGDEVLTEASAPGQGFLPEVCVAWEAAADPAREAGLRVAHMRIGVVLAKDGGALPPLLLPFRLGPGRPHRQTAGSTGAGLRWRTLSAAFAFALHNENLSGPVNVVVAESGARVRFRWRARRCSSSSNDVAASGIRRASCLLGEMGQTLLLDSARVIPAKLQAAGYNFALS